MFRRGPSKTLAVLALLAIKVPGLDWHIERDAAGQRCWLGPGAWVSEAVPALTGLLAREPKEVPTVAASSSFVVPGDVPQQLSRLELPAPEAGSALHAPQPLPVRLPRTPASASRAALRSHRTDLQSKK